MYLFAMSTEFLARCNYHPLLGLRYYTGNSAFLPTKNLAKKVEHFCAHPTERAAIEIKIDQISKRSWLTRGIYWLFNVNNYCADYYALQSYYSNKLYVEGETLIQESRTEIMRQAFNIAVKHPIVSELFPASNPLRAYWLKQVGKFGKLIEKLSIKANFDVPRNAYSNIYKVVSEDNVKRKEQHSRESPNTSTTSAHQAAPNFNETPADSITVTASMALYLKALNLNNAIGEQLPLRTLKEAYKTAVLETHPDKTQEDSSAAFQKVNSAYQTLLHQFMNPKNSNPNSIDWCEQDLIELESKLAELEILNKLNKKMDEYIELQNKLTPVLRSIRKMDESIELMKDELESLKKSDAPTQPIPEQSLGVSTTEAHDVVTEPPQENASLSIPDTVETDLPADIDHYKELNKKQDKYSELQYQYSKLEAKYIKLESDYHKYIKIESENHKYIKLLAEYTAALMTTKKLKAKLESQQKSDAPTQPISEQRVRVSSTEAREVVTEPPMANASRSIPDTVETEPKSKVTMPAVTVTLPISRSSRDRLPIRVYSVHTFWEINAGPDAAAIAENYRSGFNN